MKISDKYFDFSKRKVNLYALLRLVKSFSSVEKREFKKASRKGNDILGYVKLFNCLNELARANVNSKKLGEQVMVALKVDNKELSRLKIELKTNLFAFLSQSSTLPKKRIFSKYITANELIQRRNYKLASVAILEGKDQAHLWEEFDLWRQLVDLEALLPLRFQSASRSEEYATIQELEEEITALVEISERIKDGPKDRMTPSPKISLIDQLASHPLLNGQIPPRSDRANAIFLLAKRRIASLQRDWEKANHLSQEYIALLLNSHVFQIEGEAMVVEEFAQLAASYKLAGHSDEYWMILEKIKAFQAKSFIGKLKVFQSYYAPTIAICGDIGDVETGAMAVREIQKGIQTFRNELEDKFLLYFYFFCARFEFVGGNHKASLKWASKILESDPKNPAYPIFLPYALLMELLNHLELGNHTIVDSLLLSLNRKATSFPDSEAYLLLIFSCIRTLSNHPEPLARKKLERQLPKLRTLFQAPENSLPFSFFDPIPWVESKISGEPMHSVLQKKSSVTARLHFPNADQKTG